MRILGIDPGYGIIGWAVIENKLNLLDFGAICTQADCPFGQRLAEINQAIRQVLELYQPDCVSMEKLFFTSNTTTALDVAKSIGVMTLAFHDYGIPCCEYTPLQVKKGITGYGRATKKQMQLMIKKIYKLEKMPQPDDAADALAIATCHVFNQGQISPQRSLRNTDISLLQDRIKI